MRKYKDLPDPLLQPNAFNQYLRDNNEVVTENKVWIVIKNSFIENQLVAFCKFPVKNISEYKEILYPAKELAFYWLFEEYTGKHIYINADKDKSVPNRLHIHIKL